MTYGMHWEWRGFGRLEPTVRRRVEQLSPTTQTGLPVADRYLWRPGLSVNVKLRSGPAGDVLKFKRLWTRSEDSAYQIWVESPMDEHHLPASPALVAHIAAALGVSVAAPASPLDAASLLGYLRGLAPELEVVTVRKVRRSFFTEWGTTPVWVDVAELSEPERLTSVGLEDGGGISEDAPVEQIAAALEAVRSVREQLRVELPAMSYLDAVARWAEGKTILPLQ
jgi:hypothetical protein